MTSRIETVRYLSLAAAGLSTLYGIAQLIVLGLSINDLNQMRIYQENMQINTYGGGIDPFRSSMPGMYQRFMDMPQRRRVTALYVLHITMIVLSCIHVLASMLLFWGIASRDRNFIWPWIPSAVVISLISVAYAIVWFTGDVFRWWLVIAWFQFLTAVPMMAILIGIILIYYLMLMNYFTETPLQQPYQQAQYYADKPQQQNWQQPSVYYPPQQQIQQQPQFYTPQPTPIQQQQPPAQIMFQPIQQPAYQPQVIHPQYVPAQHQPSVLDTPAPTPQPDVFYNGIDPSMLEIAPRDHCVFCTPEGTVSKHQRHQHEQQPLFQHMH